MCSGNTSEHSTHAQIIGPTRHTHCSWGPENHKNPAGWYGSNVSFLGVSYSPCFPSFFSLDLTAINFSSSSFLLLVSVFHTVPQTIVTWYGGCWNKLGGFSVWLLFMSCVHTDTFKVGLQSHSDVNIICTDKPTLTLSRNNAMPNHQEEDQFSSTFHNFEWVLSPVKCII